MNFSLVINGLPEDNPYPSPPCSRTSRFFWRTNLVTNIQKEIKNLHSIYKKSKDGDFSQKICKFPQDIPFTHQAPGPTLFTVTKNPIIKE
jgi:hypothetical protein